MKRRARYRVKPWRGLASGNVYYDIEHEGMFLRSKVITCLSEQEANEMITKLGCWDEGRPTVPPAEDGGGEQQPADTKMKSDWFPYPIKDSDV